MPGIVRQTEGGRISIYNKSRSPFPHLTPCPEQQAVQMLPLQALWLPAFQRTFRDVKKKGRETLCQAPHLCVYLMLPKVTLHSTRLVPRSVGDKAVYNTHDRISEAFLPTFACCKQRLETSECGQCLTGLTCLVVPGSHGPSQTCVSGRSSCGKCCKSLEQAGGGKQKNSS